MTTTDQSPVPSYTDLLRLDGKVFVVAGAGQGMGRQTSHALAQVGAKVVCVDMRDDLAKEIADEVDGIPWVGDVTDRADVERLLTDTLQQAGRLDGLVDIIGMATFLPFMQITDDLWDLDFRLCLKHAYLLAQVLGGHMMDNDGGSLVFTVSVSGLTSAPQHAAYGAAKAGLANLIISLAHEFGPHGVRVNGVSPGGTLTPRMIAGLSEHQKEISAQVSPLGRMGHTTDIAGAALFLSSPLASYITGHVLPVDGAVSSIYPYKPERTGQITGKP
ncbi:MAG TPA: SDR family oxidoreductase [Jatrophihabitans sp.]